MHRDNPASRLLLGLAAGSIFFPLLAVLATDAEVGLPAYFGKGAVGPVWIGACIAAAIVVALAGLARSANVIRAGWLLGLATLLPIYFGGALGDEQPRAVRLILTNHIGVSGIDVSCNGVPLGKTPLVLDEADFHSRVPAWNEPPSQPAVSFWSDANGKPLLAHGSQWYWQPHDPFRDVRHWPPDDYMWAHSEETFMAGMAKYRYWWHFECDGFTALCAPNGFGGGGGGGRRVKTWRASLGNIQFPAVRPVVELLLEELRADEYDPSPEWIAYVLRHRELLFREVAAAAREEPEIEAVLDRLTRAHFELADEPSAADARRVLPMIFDAIDAAGAFTDPSVESRALPWVAPLCPELIGEKFRELHPDPSVRDYTSSAASEDWWTFSGSGHSAACRALEVALKSVQPPELFKPLVYLCSLQNRADGGLLAVLARYDRPEALALVRERVRQVRQHDSNRGLSMMAELDLPEYEAQLRQMLVERLRPGNSSPNTELSQFIQERVQRRSDLAELAEWIASLPKVTDEQKALALLDIPDLKATEHLARLSVAPTERQSSQIIQRLVKHPRPELDHFLLKYLDGVKPGRDRYLPNVEQAILATDSPAIRERIAQIAAGDANSWKGLVRSPPDKPLVHLDWLVPTIAAFSDADRQAESCPLLAAISTPAAESLLEAWSSDESSRVRRYAGPALKKLRDARGAAIVRRQQLADLLAGRITPQDLLTLKSFVWRNGKYEEP